MGGDGCGVAVLVEAFDALFRDGWYTNNGPRLKAFEERLAAQVGVRHAVCVCSPESALALTLWGLGVPQRIVACSGSVDANLRSSLASMGWEVAPLGHGEAVAVVLGARDTLRPPGGGRSPVFRDATGVGVLTSLRALAAEFGVAGVIGAFRDGGEVVLPDGGVLYTNDSSLADRLRTARNHHAAETFASVPIRFNVKMSEAQALFGLLCLDQLDGRSEVSR